MSGSSLWHFQCWQPVVSEFPKWSLCHICESCRSSCSTFYCLLYLLIYFQIIFFFNVIIIIFIFMILCHQVRQTEQLVLLEGIVFVLFSGDFVFVTDILELTVCFVIFGSIKSVQELPRFNTKILEAIRRNLGTTDLVKQTSFLFIPSVIINPTILWALKYLQQKQNLQKTKTVPSSNTNFYVCLKKCSKIRTKISMLRDDHPQKMTQTIWIFI